MAIILPLVGLLRGSIAANTYSHNKGGDYVRRRTTPTNPNTSRQQITRAALGTWAAAWVSALTQNQRDAWDVFASANPVKNSLGQDVFISGLAWLVKCNTRLADAGLTAVLDPPVDPAPEAFLTLSVDISAAATADVTFTPVLGATEAMQLWVSLPVSIGSSPNIKQCRLVGYSGLAEASPYAATLPHSFQVSHRGVFYACKLGGEGLISAYLQAIDDVDF